VSGEVNKWPKNVMAHTAIWKYRNCLPLLPHLKHQRKPAPFAWLILRLDAAAGDLHDVLNQGEAQSVTRSPNNLLFSKFC
jgi:hypothetical protein